MWQVKAVARPRRFYASLMAVAMVPALVLGAQLPAAATQRRRSLRSSPTRARPFGDLLVPKLTASVKDGAVGVTRRPARDGRRRGRRARRGDDGQRDEGTPVAGQLSPDGLTWPPPSRSATTSATR